MRARLLAVACLVPALALAGEESPLAPALRLEAETAPAPDAPGLDRALEALAATARKRLQDAGTPEAKLEALLRYLTQERGYAPVAPSADLRPWDFSRMLRTGRGAPETLALLYAELARRAGIPLTPVYAPDRLLLRYEEGALRVTVDLSEKAVGLTDAAYRKKLRLPEQGPYLDPLPPEGVEALLRARRSGAWLAGGRRDLALSDAERAVALDPSRCEHHLALARARWALGDALRAREALAEAKARNPESSAAILLEGELLAAEGDAEGAALAYGRALAQGTEAQQREAALGRARLRAALGQQDQAREDFTKALDLGADGAEAVLGREAAAQARDLSGAARRRVPPVTADLKTEVLKLLAQARESDASRREEAQQRLGAMGPRAVPFVQAALQGADPAPRLGALLFLTVSPNPGCLEEVLACAGSPDPKVRLASFSALGALAETEALRPRILGLLGEALEKEADAEAQRRAATVLARYGDAAALPYFRRILSDPDAENRRQAALVLGRLGDRQSLPGLRKALSDPHPRVRARAAQALGVLNDAGSVPALIQAIRDEDRDVQQEALAALRGITRQDFGADPGKWTDWWQAQP